VVKLHEGFLTMSVFKRVVIGVVSVLLGISTLIADDRPNVLFIAVDDLKPTLGCYGDRLAQTPNIDRLASRGTVFQRVYCQWPVCGPSRASLLTSLRPEANGVMDLKTDVRAKNPDVLVLPEYFKAQGYTTAGVGKIHDPRCVDNKKDADKRSWSLPFLLPKSKISDEEDGGRAVADSPNCRDAELLDGQIALEGARRLRELAQTGKPFFLAVGFKKPHLPFVAPQKYWDLYKSDSFAIAAHQGGIAADSGYATHDSPEFRGYDGVPKAGAIPEDMQRKYLHGYYACVSFVDAQVGVLLSELGQQGLEKNTIVVLWGDHGFHLGDHGMWGKHSTLEGATRVPLLIAAPHGVKVQQSQALVEFSDIFPTLCDLSGMKVPSGLAGKSLARVLDGSAPSVRVGAVTVFKNRGSYAYSFRTERYRYTEWINANSKVVARDLFDYQTDPLETRNLIDDPQYRQLRGELATQLREAGLGCDRLLSSAKLD
jgi:arylsulfatase A-like enzyme